MKYVFMVIAHMGDHGIFFRRREGTIETLDEGEIRTFQLLFLFILVEIRHFVLQLLFLLQIFGRFQIWRKKYICN